VDYETYRKAYFTDPTPESRFDFSGMGGATLYFVDFVEAVAYYTAVLGEPAYAEGDDTRGWRMGSSWLTLLRGGDGAPRNTEVGVVMKSAGEAERLQATFVEAGGTGTDPSDQLMYDPIRSCPVTDPFGTDILIFAPVQTS